MVPRNSSTYSLVVLVYDIISVCFFVVRGATYGSYACGAPSESVVVVEPVPEMSNDACSWADLIMRVNVRTTTTTTTWAEHLSVVCY